LSKITDSYLLYAKYKNDRILVVDDEEFCISAMKAVLFSTGIDIEYQVDYCITGKEAIE
jgi:CheY-like chemotaxis protein